jgi:hypothetical protein
MRKAALIGSIALLGAASGAFAARGEDAARKPSLSEALVRTTEADSQHYAFTVRITKNDRPLALRVRGQANGKTISIRLKMADVTMPDGTKLRGAGSAALLDGPFLYERAPSNVMLGDLKWLRMRVVDLPNGSAELKALHALTPKPLLRVLGRANMKQAPAGARLYRGTVAYDDPIVRGSLLRLTGGIEFRSLRLSAFVADDGLVHRLVLTGRTPDRKSTLSVSARLFDFGRPVHVTPPEPGTFMDEHLAELAA